MEYSDLNIFIFSNILQFLDSQEYIDSENLELPSSQSVPHNSQSQSSFVPSSESSKSEDSEMLEESFIDGDIHVIYTTAFLKFNVAESEDFTNATVLVMWTCLLQLLCKCQRQGCGAPVLPDNMKPIRNGKLN